jgi:uncharacterized protein
MEGGCHTAGDETGQGVAECATQALQEALGERLVGVVLYGSRARDDARPGSDWDLLVVARDLPQGTMARHLALKRALPEACRAQVSLLTRTPEEFEAHVSSLYLEIALDGRILFDPTGIVGDRLAGLRATAERRGLVRVETDSGYDWRWESTPAHPWDAPWEGRR